MDATTSSGSVHPNEGVELDKKELKTALQSLSLTWAPVGDYLVIMNSESDVDICGEPYLAMQIWLNLRSGKFISRLWNQTIAKGTAVSIAHFLATCKDFQWKPCVGCPVATQEVNKNGYTILHSPVPRKVSLWCHKLLKDIECGSQACPECLSLQGNFIKNEVSVKEMCEMKSECELTNGSVRETDKKSSHPHQGPSSQMPAHCMVKSETTSDHFISDPRPLNNSVIVKKIMKKRPRRLNPSCKRKPWSPGKCEWCDHEKKYTRYTAWFEHAKRTHFWGKFHCPKCHQREDFASDLIKHMKEAEHGLDDQIVCPYCKAGKSLQVIETHYRECLEDKIRMENNRNRKTLVVCDICGKSVTKQCYNQHKKMHLREQLAKTQEDTSHLFYYCDQCGKRFTSRSKLTDHTKSEHRNVTYACPDCPEIFKTHQQRSNHRIVVHTDKFKCKHCGTCFRDSFALLSHERKHEDPQFQCRHCDKKLKSEEALLGHERMHTGEKPFACEICSASFTLFHSLSQHMKGVHKIAGNKGGKVGWTRKEK